MATVDGGRRSTAVLLRGYRQDQERRGLRPATIVRMRDNLRTFARGLPPGISLLDVDVEHVQSWLDARHIEPRTRYHWLSCLSNFYQWAIRAEIAEHDPTARIIRPKLRRNLPRPIVDEDLEVAIDMAPDKMRGWLSLMAYAGLRCQEVAGLRAEDLLTSHDPPMIFVAAGKGGHERTVPMAEAAERALRAHGVPRTGPVFRTYAGLAHTPQGVSRQTALYLRSVGVDATAHQLRHWFATKLYALTRDLVLVQELLGHASIATTRIYVSFDAGAAADVVRQLEVRQARGRHPSAAGVATETATVHDYGVTA